MRVGVLLLCLMFVVCGMALAEETSSPKYQAPNPGLNGLFNTYLNHTHDLDRSDPMGAGVDLTLWENEKGTVATDVEFKYDFENEEHSTFVVARVNLWKLFKGE